MAYRPRSDRRGARRGEPRRGARGGAGGGGGGGGGGGYARGSRSRRAADSGGPNTTAMAVGIGLLIAVIVVVVIVSGSKKPPREPEYAPTELTGDSVVDKGPPKPKKVERNPPPDISPEIIQRAKQIVVEMESDRAAGDACYEDAMRAKRSGDDDTWRAKLNEAADHFVNIRDKWNEEVIGDIEGELPMSCDWDAEEVANYHLGREGSKVTKALQTLASIKKQLGVR